ncbi:DUF4239 domain-containing protein [Enterovirga rhinocerotis]|uniref:Uncharacterized protein DUF4239 n=1 Tax=Enterovirga rhinocerotis TaxID=1339210 RepID=A0A4V3DXQ7_9HYPH|nr:DUF4239 domain-containing protein [Enterovirga rhinocerotis]TDR89689.1 uncharacterized protein DUF4239 [Enterovirga rhinocerotis]
MFIAFHQLPLSVMFFVVLAMGTASCWLLIGLVRITVPLLGYEPHEPLPLRESLINACGGLFALIVAFSAAGIWNDAVAARNAVQREADAVENAMVLAATLPADAQATIGGSLRAYLREVVAVDWPAMKLSTPQEDPVFERAEAHLLSAITLVSREASTGSPTTYTPLLNQLLDIRHARLARIAASNAGITWAQWIAMWLISTATLLAILFCNNHAFRMQIVAGHIYVVVVSAAYFVILAHDRPFIGQISIEPISMQALLQR